MNYLNKLNNPYIKTMVAVLIVCYGGLIPLTKKDANLCNPVIQLSIILVVFYIGNFSTGLSVLLAITAVLMFINCDSLSRQRKQKAFQKTIQNMPDLTKVQMDTQQAVTFPFQGVSNSSLLIE